MGRFCQRLLAAILGGIVINVLVDKAGKIVDKYIDEYEKRQIPEERFHIDKNGNIWLRDEDCEIT